MYHTEHQTKHNKSPNMTFFKQSPIYRSTAATSSAPLAGRRRGVPWWGAGAPDDADAAHPRRLGVRRWIRRFQGGIKIWNFWSGWLDASIVSSCILHHFQHSYPPVICYIAMENHLDINGKIHYQW